MEPTKAQDNETEGHKQMKFQEQLTNQTCDLSKLSKSRILKEAQKKALYLALDIPALQNFRQSIGLPHKDFHVTLGFENDDIYMRIIGIGSNGADILRPFPKLADAQYQGYAKQLSDLRFGLLSGKERE